MTRSTESPCGPAAARGPAGAPERTRHTGSHASSRAGLTTNRRVRARVARLAGERERARANSQGLSCVGARARLVRARASVRARVRSSMSSYCATVASTSTGPRRARPRNTRARGLPRALRPKEARAVRATAASAPRRARAGAAVAAGRLERGACSARARAGVVAGVREPRARAGASCAPRASAPRARARALRRASALVCGDWVVPPARRHGASGSAREGSVSLQAVL